MFADIDFEVDIDKRRAQLKVPGYIEQRGEPIVNPVTGAEYRGRIDLPDGFEYTMAEMGRGWTKTTGPIALTWPTRMASSQNCICARTASSTDAQ